MPLSEREQALLEQMERALYAEDPRFAEQLATASSPTIRRRRLAIGVVGTLVGLGVVLVGVMQQLVWVGVIGFLVMVGAAVYALTQPRRAPIGAVRPDGSIQHHRPARTRGGGVTATQRLTARGRGIRRQSTRRQGTFMQRLEQRWDDRRSRGEF